MLRTAQLFQSTLPPEGISANQLGGGNKWLTWSEMTRRVLDRFQSETSEMQAPKIVRLLGGKEYDCTYGYPLEDLQKLRSYASLKKLAVALLKFDPDEEIYFFDNLLDDQFAGQQLNKLFGSLRTIIAELEGNVMAALYAPLSYVGKEASDFPLHSDLYVPHLLWNIFDQVPKDGSGSPIFLKVSVFRRLIDECDVPERSRSALLTCLDDEASVDRFNSFYNLLYVRQSTWATRLTAAMAQRQELMHLQYGQGYLLHDRKWLHGRLAPSGGVNTRRVHRFVFSPTKNV